VKKGNFVKHESKNRARNAFKFKMEPEIITTKLLAPLESDSYETTDIEAIFDRDLPTAEPTNSRRSIVQLLADVCIRVLILVTGLSLGLITFFPNGMMCDSGTTIAVTLSMIGLSASVLFVMAGIIGAICKKWYFLLYPLGLQLLVLSPALIYSIFGWN
jgi:hypothetical protein